MNKRHQLGFPPLQRGGQGGWGPDKPAPSLTNCASEVLLSGSPPRKRGAGGVGAGQTIAVAVLASQAKPALLAPHLAKGPGGWGCRPTNPARSPPSRANVDGAEAKRKKRAVADE